VDRLFFELVFDDFTEDIGILVKMEKKRKKNRKMKEKKEGKVAMEGKMLVFDPIGKNPIKSVLVFWKRFMSKHAKVNA
jgi:hypothetical protein